MFKNAYPNTAYINLITDDLPLISQIKWRIYGQNFTKQHFEQFLKENKEAIKKLGERKIKNLFPPAQRSTINESNFVDEMIDNLKNNYDKIFIKK